MKTRILVALLCLFPLFVVAQNYEQQGDELFKQAQYEQAVKKYKAAEVSVEMNGKKPSSQLVQKKEKAQKCANLLKKATSAEENNQYSEAAKAYEDLYALHALAAYQKKSQTLKKSSSTQSYGTQTIATDTKQKSEGTVDIVIPYGVTEVKEHEYSYRKDIKSVVIPNSVVSIGSSAFRGCSGLTSVTIPNSVTSIGAFAFVGCSSLTFVTIPNSVTSIGYQAFCDCGGLTSVTIGNSVTNIGEHAFRGCKKLTSVSIGNSVTSIKDWAFSNCSGLTSVTIGNRVTSIGYGTFMECTGLTSVTIPNSVTSIGDAAFSGCSSLTSINVEVNNPNYCSIDGVLFNKNKTKLIRYPPGGKSGFYAIPNSVTWIGDGAFSECTSLTSVTIPNSVTSICDDAFYECSSLTSIMIPNSVTFIGWRAFTGCKKLTIRLPERFRGKVDLKYCKEVIYY